jgi:hypothetical protein
MGIGIVADADGIGIPASGYLSPTGTFPYRSIPVPDCSHFSGTGLVPELAFVVVNTIYNNILSAL